MRLNAGIAWGSCSIKGKYGHTGTTAWCDNGQNCTDPNFVTHLPIFVIVSYWILSLSVLTLLLTSGVLELGRLVVYEF